MIMHLYILIIFGDLMANSWANKNEFFRFPGTANTLNRIQRRSKYLKHLEFNTLNESMNHAIRVAYENCRILAQWERWNCPEHDFLKFPKMKITKEQAFMESLSAAASMHTLIYHCFQGKFARCKCLKRKFSCSACSFGMKDIMKFGRNVIKNYLNSKKQISDEVRTHNQKVGINVVKKMTNWNETCMSKSKIASFSTIAEVLKTRWKVAKKFQHSLVFENKSIKKKLKNELVYIEESPDYCLRNNSLEINGTEGRICMQKLNSESETERTETCHILCFSCGFFVNEKITHVGKRCNCRMKSSCCEVSCDTCYSKMITFYCAR